MDDTPFDKLKAKDSELAYKVLGYVDKHKSELKLLPAPFDGSCRSATAMQLSMIITAVKSEEEA